MRTKHIFDYHPILNKIQTGGDEDIERSLRVLEKEHAEIRGSSKNGVGFPGVKKKSPCGFFLGLGFLV